MSAPAAMPTLLVTGTNRGLGLEATRQFSADGWTVHACCRDPQSAADLRTLAADAHGAVTIHRLDMDDFAAVDALASDLRGTAIDVLLNSAAIYGGSDQEFGSIDYTAWMATFRTNTLAPMKMAEAFVDHVAASERKLIVTLTSMLASIARNDLGKLHIYRTSKAATNMVMRVLAVDLATRGVTAFNIHPGWARTDMGGPTAAISPTESIAGVKRVIETAGPEQSGAFVDYKGETWPW